MRKKDKDFYKFEHKRYKGPYKQRNFKKASQTKFDESVRRFERKAQDTADSFENRVRGNMKPFFDGFLAWLENIKSFDTFLSLFRFNITFKMTLGFALFMIQLIVIVNLVIFGSLKFSLYQDAVDDLTVRSEAIIELADKNRGEENRVYFNDILGLLGVDITIYSQYLEPVASSVTPLPQWIPAEDREAFSPFRYHFPEQIYKQSWFKVDDSDFIILASYSMAEAQATLDRITIVSLFLSFMLILWAIRSSSRISQKQLAPLHVMTTNVQNISINSLDKRLNVRGTKDELKDLAMVFNKLMDNIQLSYERQRQFVSDASHELRTPIAVIKGYANMLDRWGKEDPEILAESIDAIQSEADNMQSLVESLLFIARNDKGTLKMEMDAFDLSDLMYEIVKETSLIDSSHNIVPDIVASLPFYGSGDKLKQALRVFIDNAIKYTPEGGEIRIRLTSTEKQVLIGIEDNGIGISSEDLPHIFDRFYRADKSRSKLADSPQKTGGTGLGLAIAKIIVEQHRGKIQVESALNSGTKVSILLPRRKKESYQEKSQSSSEESE